MTCATGKWLNAYPSELGTFSLPLIYSRTEAKLPVRLPERIEGYPAVVYRVEEDTQLVWIICLKIAIALTPHGKCTCLEFSFTRAHIGGLRFLGRLLHKFFFLGEPCLAACSVHHGKFEFQSGKRCELLYILACYARHGHV